MEINKILNHLGLSCFIAVGALAGWCIGSFSGVIFGALLGGLYGHLIEQSL